MAKDKDTSKTFHYVRCDAFKAVKVDMERAATFEAELGIIAMTSKRPIRDALKAVALSPFKTVFVVDAKSGIVGYAISQNEAYVVAARKKGGGGGKERPPLPPSDTENCCATCMARGADGCLTMENFDCWCLYTGGGSGKGVLDTNDPLEVLMP